MKKSKAFTLVELMVVISIIGLLMAILLPALHRARSLGQRTACANHLKTLALANEAYAGTHEYAYVPVNYVTRQGDELQWLNNSDFRACISIDSYKTTDDRGEFDVPEEFLCPSDRIGRDPGNRYRGVLCSYGYNYTEWKKWGDTSMAPINNYGGHFAHKIKRPSAKLAFTDGIDWWVEWSAADYSGEVDPHDGWGWDRIGQARIKVYKDKGFHGPTIYRHNEGANIAFYDCHVEYMHKEEIFVIEDFEADPQRPGMWVVDLDFYREHHQTP